MNREVSVENIMIGKRSRVMPLEAIEAVARTEDADVIIKRSELSNKVPAIRKKICCKRKRVKDKK
jgi:hypothetical protein